jgi:hypothetical protein
VPGVPHRQISAKEWQIELHLIARIAVFIRWAAEDVSNMPGCVINSSLSMFQQESTSTSSQRPEHIHHANILLLLAGYAWQIGIVQRARRGLSAIVIV